MKKLSVILSIVILITILGQSISFAATGDQDENKQVISRLAPSANAILTSNLLSIKICARVWENYKKGITTTVIGLKGIDAEHLYVDTVLSDIGNLDFKEDIVRDGDKAKITITAYEIEEFKKTAELEAAENEIVKAANAYSTTREKLEYINDTIVATTRYGESEYQYSARGVFLLKEAVCSGYSEAVRDICQKLGVKWSYIYGENHRSTIVFVDGQWYVWDLTWDAVGKDQMDKDVIVDVVRNADGKGGQAVKMPAKRQYFLLPMEGGRYDKYYGYLNPNAKNLGLSETVFSILYPDEGNLDLSLAQYEIDPKLIKDTTSTTTVTDTGDTAPFVSATRTGTQMSSTVMVNNKKVAFEAYTIDGNNYFKLRDVAMAIRGTAKQFEVKYDAASKAINLLPGVPYIPVGGELQPAKLSTSFSIDNKGKVTKIQKPASKAAIPTTSMILKNGIEMQNLTVYTISGSNYFKLRDLADQLGFSVDYNNTTKVITINSK